MFYWKKLFLAVSLLFSGRSMAAEIPCAEMLRMMVMHYQHALVGMGDEESPSSGWKKSLEVEAIKPAEDYIRRLEDSVLELYETAPEFRNKKLEAFGASFGLDADQARAVMDYYAFHIFEDIRIVGDPKEVWERFRQLRRSIKLTITKEGNPSLRLMYYLVNLTHLSVPEMAVQLGMMESQVYAELAILRVFIYDLFKINGVLEIARTRYQQSEAIETIARDLGVGVQALTFILKYDQELIRGASWNQTVIFEGESLPRYQVAIILWNKGDSAAVIAATLNELAKTTEPTHPDFVTEGAVSLRLKTLGKTSWQKRLLLAEKEIPGYGWVKLKGKLNPEIADRFIQDHYFESLEWLAEQLEITPKGLEVYIDRNDGFILSGRASAPERGKYIQDRQRRVKELLEKYEKQREEIRRAGLALLQTRPSEDHPDVFQSFRDLEKGGMAALRRTADDLPDILEFFSSDTPRGLRRLLEGLSEEQKAILEIAIDQRVGLKAGARAVRGGNVALAQVFDAFYWLQEAWQAEDPLRFASVDLASANGLRRFIGLILNQPYLVNLDSFAKFRKTDVGGMSAFKRDGGLVLPNFSMSSKLALHSLLVGLPAIKKREIAATIAARIENPTGGNALLGQARPQAAVFDVLYAILEAQRAISPQDFEATALETPAGIVKMIGTILKNPSILQKDNFQLFIQPDVGGLYAFKGEGFKTRVIIARFNTDVRDAIRELLVGLPDAEIKTLSSILDGWSPRLGDQALRGGVAAQAQIFDMLCSIQAAWVKHDPTRFGGEGMELISRAGMTKFVATVLDKPSYLHPDRFRNFSNLEVGALSALKVGKGKRRDNLPSQETLEQLATALPVGVREEVSKKVTARLSKSALKNALGSGASSKVAAEQVFDCFFWIKAAWDKADPQTYLEMDIDKPEDLLKFVGTVLETPSLVEMGKFEIFSDITTGPLSLFKVGSGKVSILPEFRSNTPKELISLIQSLPIEEREPLSARILAHVLPDAGERALNNSGDAKARIFDALSWIQAAWKKYDPNVYGNLSFSTPESLRDFIARLR